MQHSLGHVAAVGAVEAQHAAELWAVAVIPATWESGQRVQLEACLFGASCQPCRVAQEAMLATPPAVQRSTAQCITHSPHCSSTSWRVLVKTSMALSRQRSSASMRRPIAYASSISARVMVPAIQGQGSIVQQQAQQEQSCLGMQTCIASTQDAGGHAKPGSASIIPTHHSPEASRCSSLLRPRLCPVITM